MQNDIETDGDAEAQDDEPEIVLGSREQLLHLLAEAAEIEHTLMCSYLYAAFSLKRREDEGLSTEEGEAVERWRQAIMNVAVEEMGHLLIVANLTVAVGGRAHFARPNFPVEPGYFPAGVVVRLRAFSMETLDHFIFLERPQGMAGDDDGTYKQPAYRRDQAILGLMPGAQDYATIGHLYEAIRANLRFLGSRLGKAHLFVGPPESQVGHKVIDLEGVDAICDLDGACKAIDVIVEQGEGSASDRDDSHYRSFLGVREEFERLKQANAAFHPAWPAADNPVLRRPPEPQDKVYIDDPKAAELLDFACATYGLLLRLLVQSFGRQGLERRAQQERLISAAIDLMHVLAEVSDALARTPASSGTPGVNAGMSFTMLRGIEPLLPGVAEQQLLAERLKALARSARGLHLRSGKALSKLASGFSVHV